MVKKTIAGVLSAVMCATTLLYDAPFSSRNTAQEEEQLPAASTGVQEEMGLTGSNSLARYLARQGTEQAAEAKPTAQPLKAAAADAVYAVTNLDFDRETGIVQVTSTQSEAATLRASFIDEDSPANVYTVDYGVPAGEYVHSTFSADPAQLPEYFTVSVQLIGRAGLPLCKAFEIKTYNREMQEIIQTEASDFAPEQVVNLDEDETTNFIVLSEDTVRAETTEESNVLVSADYDQNIYVFDHIDESIRSLEKGQYFYIQPTENDIISTDIQEIVIDGDTATITGTGEIDDMFDFIKIESETEQTVEGEYYGAPYHSVNAQVISNEDELNDRLKAVDPDAELSEYTKKNSCSTEFQLGKAPIKITPSLNYEVTTKWNVYKKFHYLNLFLVTETKVTINVKAETDKEEKEEEDDKKKDHLIELPIYTNGAVDVNFIGDVEIDLDGVVELEVGLQFTKGFVFDSKDGLEFIMFDTNPILKKFEAQVEFSLEVKIGVEIKALKGLLTASVTGGLKGTASVEAENGTFETLKKTGNSVFLPDPAASSDTIHCDEKCLKIHLELKLVIGAEVSAGFDIKDSKSGFGKMLNKIGADKLKVSKEYEKEFDSVLGHKLPVYDMYLSQNSSGVYKGIKFNFVKAEDGQETECPHKAFRVTFNFYLGNAPANIPQLGIKVNVDGTDFDVTSDKLVLYAMPRSSAYTYTVSVGSDRKTSKSFKIDETTVDIPVILTWPQTGTGKPTYDNGDIQTGKAITTVTEPNITEPFVFDYSDKIPSAELLNKKNQTYDLGEHISGMFNNDGSFLVYGYGDMDPNVSIPAEVRKQILEIVFMDQDPSDGLYINNIANKLFSGSKNLEVVYMPARLTAIGDSAFSSCESLKWLRYGGETDTTQTFKLPETLTTIGNGAFNGCSAAEFGDLQIPESVTTIGFQTFKDCTKITSVSVPGKNVTSIYSYAFQNCTAMKEAYLNTNVKCADAESSCWFSGCSALEKLTIPAFNVGTKKVSWVLIDLFGAYNSDVPKVLTDVTVLSGTVIPPNYFSGLSQLKNVTYPDNITEIGNSAFSGCTNLRSAPLPETLTKIDAGAFNGCITAAFGDLRIPESVTLIGHQCFKECLKITSVYVPGIQETSVYSYAFQDCTAMKEAYFGANVKCADTESSCWFSECSALEKLTIPAFNVGTKKIDWVFRDLFGAYNSDVPKVLTDVTVLSGTVIPPYYFSGLSQLKNVTYPDNITEIGNSAFAGCTNLRSAPLPETLTTIGAGAFNGCTAAEFGDLQIPESVTLIGHQSFKDCYKITSVCVPGIQETSVYSYAFQNCTALKEAYFGANVKCADAESSCWFSECSALEKLTIPAFNLGTKKVNWVFRDLFGAYNSNVSKVLNEVVVTGGTVIPENYFNGLAFIKSVTFSSELETVERGAFSGCAALAEAYLIGEDSDWDKVDIVENGNQPLLDIVRKGRLVAILSDPKDATAEDGKTAVFAVYAAGKYELDYHWMYSWDGGENWMAVDSDGTNKLTVEASPEKDGYLYRCVITDGGHSGRVTSGAAKLTVTEKTETPETPQTPQDPKERPGYKPGDANGDNSIDVSDAVLVARFAVGDVTATIKDIGVINGDVNGDGNTDIQDVTVILMFIAKRIMAFPVEET
ncbi:MAG: leucine-rich repeat protein [Oscillospiraceae bacterium]|nr:leucine-rich repeat protein [Oscillospiraceae bacterium]